MPTDITIRWTPWPGRRPQVRSARLILSGLLVWAGWGVLEGAEGGFDAVPVLLFGMCLFILAAVLAAGPIADLFPWSGGDLFFPGERLREKPPVYGIADSLRKRGEYQQAYDAYYAISETHPQSMKAYIQMIKVAAEDMNEPSRARSALRHGLESLELDKDREGLQRLFDGMITLTEPKQRPRRIRRRRDRP